MCEAAHHHQVVPTKDFVAKIKAAVEARVPSRYARLLCWHTSTHTCIACCSINTCLSVYLLSQTLVLPASCRAAP